MRPGMASELLRELAPLLAEEGIDVDNLDVPDVDTLQQAMNRAIERQNMVRFTPVGQARELAAVTLRLAGEAIADGDTRLAAAVLDQAQPESPDGSAATVAGCIGVALGLLDQWLPGHDRSIPADLGKLTRLPAGHWTGERRRRRYRDPCPQGPRLRLPGCADRQTRRPVRAVRQQPCPHCRAPGLVATRRHAPARSGAHDHPLKPLRSQQCRILRQIASSRRDG
jgi:hypothetical protein